MLMLQLTHFIEYSCQQKGKEGTGLAGRLRGTAPSSVHDTPGEDLAVDRARAHILGSKQQLEMWKGTIRSLYVLQKWQ